MKERHFFFLVEDLPQFIQRWVLGIKPSPPSMLNRASVQPVNEFLAAFVNSTETDIQFSADGLCTGANALLTPLRGLDYDTIRLRLRAISSLNPVVNLHEETGTITLVFGPRTVVLRSIFAPKGAAIVLKKT